MYEKYLVKEGRLKNTKVNGKVVGFQFDIRNCDYRGCFLSLLHGYYIKLDGEVYPRAVQKFGINNKPPRDFDEIATCAWEHWDYADWGTVYVEKPGGLSKGKHKLEVKQASLVQYGWQAHDEELVKNMPEPGPERGPGLGPKQLNPFHYEMTVE